MKTLPSKRPSASDFSDLTPTERRSRIAALVLAAGSAFGFAIKLLFFP